MNKIGDDIMSEMSFGEKLIQSAKQAEAHSAGKKKLRTNVIEIQPIPNYDPQQIKNIRARLGLTQVLMGGIVGVSSKTIEAWEIGYRRPNGTAMRVLAELDTNPNYFKKIAKVS
jgi:putative transcriptional regulator